MIIFIFGCSFNLPLTHGHKKFAQILFIPPFFFFLFFIEDQTEIGGGLVGDNEVGWRNETMLHGRLASFWSFSC